MANNKKYFFGDTEVSKEEKVKKVNEVFDSVAKRYDIMNDILSLGAHRLWKEILVNSISNIISSRKKFCYLDLACGTGDIARLYIEATKNNASIMCVDSNFKMIKECKKNLKQYKNILTVGVAFSFQKHHKLPINHNDVKLDFIITEKGIN